MDATAPEWAPEHEVGPDLAARLVAERWPELRGVAMEPLGIGWDNTVFVAGGEWVFRFPRRSVAVPLIEREIAALPVLGPRLPLPIPVPEYVARGGSPDFPWPFWGARMVPGRELAEAGLGDGARERAAAGVIDWGDACLADPAVDLSLAYGAFAGTARAVLLEAYGRPVPPERELAARVLALFLCAALAQYAAAEGHRTLLAEALTGIGRAARG
ncbi:phosphotransferase [Spirillospora sp. CA-255316]